MATAKSTKREQFRKRLTLVPAVAYIRMSSDKQEASPEQQKAEILKLAEREGYHIIRWYQDDGIAGWKEEREGFQRLIGDVDRRGDFQAVLCWDQNRFSRFPVLEANHYWYLLDKAGIHLTTVNQGKLDWNSIAGWLTASIKQHADSQHRFQLSADVKRGKRARAERGEWQGRIPFAYVVVDCRLQLGDPLQVELVRRLFREYLKGHSIRGIAKRLNDEGLGSHTSAGWSPTTVSGILRNPAYAGIFKWQDIEIPNNHPAIIDGETFEAVQRRLSERQKNTTPHHNGGEYILSGILRCGRCEGTMMGMQQPGKNVYYRCWRWNAKRMCEHSNTVKQNDVFSHVVDAIESHWMNPKTVKRLRDELHRQIDHDNPVVNPKRLQKQLGSLETKLTKAKRRLVEVDTDMLPVVQEHLRELRQQQEQLQAAVEAARMPREHIYANVDERIDRAMNAFSGLRETLEKADTVHCREFLQEAVQKVEVWAERNGKRNHFRVERGRISLRSDNLFASSG